jgi:ATP:ADP antiporter, AAA family
VIDHSQPPARPSPRGRFLAAIAAVERYETPAIVASFFLFFCVMSGYFAVRPVRDTVGSLMGRQRLADLWIWTWVASIAVIPIYGFLVARFRRSVFLPWTYGAVALVLVIVGMAFQNGQPGVLLSQLFWVFLSVLNLFIISVFWSFLLELYRTEQTRRLFGLIAAGGTAGALAGPLVTDFAVGRIGNSGVLFMGAALFVGAILCQRILLGLWKSEGTSAAAAGETRDRAIGGNPLAGVTLVARSPYLLGIASFVFLLASVTTLLYFEQLRLVDIMYPSGVEGMREARTRLFARLDWIVQSLTIVAQLFITGRVATRLGLGVLLTMIPAAMVFGFTVLALWNTAAVLLVLMVARRAGEYAFVRPGREMLWSPLDKETKYKAKNFVDVPVYRGADALVAQVQIGSGVGPTVIALFGIVTAALGAFNGWWLGRRHDAAAAEQRRAA